MQQIYTSGSIDEETGALWLIARTGSGGFALGRVASYKLTAGYYHDPDEELLLSEDRDSLIAFLSELRVEMRLRGQGLGRRLVEAWLLAAYEAGADAAYLQALPDDGPKDPRLDVLLPFYESFGFRVVPASHAHRAFKYMRLDLRSRP